MAIAENICKLQEQTGESNYKVAKALGVSQTSVQNWRTGKTKPIGIYTEKLAEHFGVSVEALKK